MSDKLTPYMAKIARSQDRERRDPGNLPLHKIEDHELRIQRTLGAVFRRDGHEAVDNDTPLDALLAKERGGYDETGDSLDRRGAIDALLDYLFAADPHPGAVMRRLYIVAYALRPQAVIGMNMTDLANLFGETKAAMSWRIEKIFSGYLKKNGAKGFKLPGQKSEESRAVYRQAQKGNTNRRKKPRLRRPDSTKTDGRNYDNY